MAEKRMFAMTIVDSDEFLDMPLSSQALYFHLSMRADDDGFINNPKKIQRLIGARDDDAAVLVAKKFIIPFDTGVVVIKHWRINNYLRSDRYHETVYKEEKKQLSIKENGAYTLSNDTGTPTGIPMVNQRYTENRVDKSREEKIREDESSIDRQAASPDVPTKGIISKDDHSRSIVFMTHFNSIKGVLPCNKMLASREIAISTIYSHFSEEEINLAFDNLRNSPFLLGKAPGSDGKYFSAKFDWFIELGNFTKVYEGNYLVTEPEQSVSVEREYDASDYLNQGGTL